MEDIWSHFMNCKFFLWMFVSSSKIGSENACAKQGRRNKWVHFTSQILADHLVTLFRGVSGYQTLGGQVVMGRVVACRRRPAAPSILPKSWWAIAHPAHPPLTTLLLQLEVHIIPSTLCTPSTARSPIRILRPSTGPARGKVESMWLFYETFDPSIWNLKPKLREGEEAVILSCG